MKSRLLRNKHEKIITYSNDKIAYLQILIEI